MPSYTSVAKAAVVQAEPVWLDADATISKSVEFIERAAREGAEIIAFPEVFIPGYPWWIWLGDQKGKDADTARQEGSELDAKMPLRGSLLRAILQ